MLSGYGWQTGQHGAECDGFIKELELRGYDLTTLRFSIEKRQVDSVVPSGDGSTGPEQV
jgi:hypothetical protein